MQGLLCSFELVQDRGELLRIDTGCLLQGIELNDLAFQLFNDFGFEITATENFQGVNQGVQGRATVPHRIAAQCVVGLAKQVLQTQKGPDAFVKGLLINDGFYHGVHFTHFVIARGTAW